METTASPMVILVNDEQPSNALSPIDFTLAGKVISFKLVQPLKAPSFMDSTLAGKDMEVRLVLPAKALFPIALINFPLYFSGSSTSLTTLVFILTRV